MKDYSKLDEQVFKLSKADIVKDEHENNIFYNQYGKHTKELVTALHKAGFKTIFDWDNYIKIQDLLKAKQSMIKELYDEDPKLAAGLVVVLCENYVTVDEEEKNHDIDYKAIFDRFISEYL